MTTAAQRMTGWMIGAVRIEIVVFDGFDEIDAFGPFEVLSTEGFSTSLVVIGPPRTIISQGGLQLVIADPSVTRTEWWSPVAAG